MPQHPAPDKPAEDHAAYAAVEHLYHAYLTGLILMLVTRAGADIAAEVVFRLFRRQQKALFLPGLRKLGLDRTEKVLVHNHMVSPRDVVAAVLPDPLTLGDKMSGKTCAGLYVTGKGKDGNPRAVYLYHVCDNDWSMKEYGAQAVVWQTAMNPVVALELLSTGAWSGAGVLGPEALPSEPFLDLLKDGYGQEWKMEERTA